MGKYFGTDGFRGEANVTLTADHAYQVGRFLGWYCGECKRRGGDSEPAKVVIGKDTRRSSYMFEYALAAGLTASGADAYLLHVTTTPSVSYVVRTEDFDCGLMISASHNPYYDNGIKVINSEGHKMEAEVEAKIEAYIDGEIDEIPLATKESIGRTVDYAAGRNRYIGHLISLATRSFKDMRVGLDCANGSASSVAKSVFDALGAKTYVINNEPNGVNINTNCGSTHIEVLQEYVKEKHLDIGFAYDGDADRCIAVDENGNVVDGDLILYVCGKYMKEHGQLKDDTIVTTIMSNLGLYKACDKIGMKYEKTQVGDKYVYENMVKNGFMLGGESLKSAMRCGFSMAQIGEFSFIIASLGLSLGVISNFLYPVVVAVSVITTFLTPYMIRLAQPSYQLMEKHLPSKFINILNHFAMSRPSTQQQSKWKSLIRQMVINTVAYSILSAAAIAMMFTFVLPLMRNMLPGWNLHWYANAITGLLTIVLISPFLRAIVMKKNHSPEWKRLWVESSINRIPLLFTIFVRYVIALGFIFYIINYLSRFTNALMVCIGAVIVLLMLGSRRIKKRSIVMERLFLHNLRSRDIAAQVNGEKRPLYEGHLLDRDIHISEIEVPEDSIWCGKSLKELHLRQRFGIDMSSIRRGSQRLNIPNGDTMIFPGDKLQIIGNDDQVHKFAQALTTELAPEDLEIEKREMKLRQLIISGGSEFLGKTLEESGIRNKYNCMVVGLEEGQENLTHILPSRVFEKGDIIWLVGEEADLQKIQEKS